MNINILNELYGKCWNNTATEEERASFLEYICMPELEDATKALLLEALNNKDIAAVLDQQDADRIFDAIIHTCK